MIEDDGPGIIGEAMDGIACGQRWDGSKPGTGFGISVSRDIAGEMGATARSRPLEFRRIAGDVDLARRADCVGGIEAATRTVGPASQAEGNP